jgi:hypothetical protein
MKKITVEQVKAARALLLWSQETLTEKTGLGIATIKRIEALSGPLTGTQRTVSAIRSALENAGVEFLADGEASATGGAGVRLKG